jgi:hypothetical protein
LAVTAGPKSSWCRAKPLWSVFSFFFPIANSKHREKSMPNVTIPHCFAGQKRMKLGDRLPSLFAWEEDKTTLMQMPLHNDIGG